MLPNPKTWQIFVSKFGFLEYAILIYIQSFRES